MSPGRLVDIVINTVTISIVFQNSHLSSVNQIISWHSSSMNDIIHYENDSYYLLTIDYNETGPLELQLHSLVMSVVKPLSSNITVSH